MSIVLDEFIFVVAAFASPKRLCTGELVDHKATDGPNDTLTQNSDRISWCGFLYCFATAAVYSRVNGLDRYLQTRIHPAYTMDRQAAAVTTTAFSQYGRTYTKIKKKLDEKWPS